VITAEEEKLVKMEKLGFRVSKDSRALKETMFLGLRVKAVFQALSVRQVSKVNPETLVKWAKSI
jgi:hypothetical protein